MRAGEGEGAGGENQSAPGDEKTSSSYTQSHTPLNRVEDTWLQFGTENRTARGFQSVTHLRGSYATTVCHHVVRHCIDRGVSGSCGLFEGKH